MKKGQKLWTREELILAINLYCKLPFGRLHRSNPEVVRLANLIHRTPSSVAYKLVNFASLDPSLKKRGIKGASNASKLDKAIWNEFYNNWESLPYESEKLRAKLENTTVEGLHNLDVEQIPKGRTRDQVIKARVNQSFFRSSVLASYDFKCCITGIDLPELLVASHIIPWSENKEHRLNPQNGLCLNSLHDKAFDKGFIGFDEKFRLIVSRKLKSSKNDYIQKYFIQFEGAPIQQPKRFLPDLMFLEYHRDVVFKA